MDIILNLAFGMIHLSVSSVKGERLLSEREFPESPLNEGGMAGHTKAGISVGTSGGGASPVSTCKTVFMEGLWCGFG